jgi:hypothetical protein
MKFSPENVKIRLEQRGISLSEKEYDLYFNLLEFLLKNMDELLTKDEVKTLFEWISEISDEGKALALVLITAVINVKHFESYQEFKGMNIDTYNKKMTELRKNADELAKYSESPITIQFPIHPNTIAAEIKTSIDTDNLSENDKDRYWDAFRDFSGISQIRKPKANSFIFDNHITMGHKEKIKYYSYTTTK